MTAVPQFPPTTLPGDPAGLVDACLDAAQQLARKAAGASSAAEGKDFAQGVLAFAQALAVLNPTTDVNGVPLEHHENLARIGKPEPAEAAKKKRLRLTRDNEGRATGAEVEG